MNIKLYIISIMALLYLNGCSAEPYDNIQEEIDKYTIGTGEAVERAINNDIHDYAQIVNFEDNKFSVSGVANSSTDSVDWYAFIAPENGKYICAIDYVDGSDAGFNMYHQGNYEVNGNIGNTYTYSDATDLAIYDEYNIAILSDSPTGGWDTKSDSEFEINSGNKVYIEVEMQSSGGNDASYTLDCFTQAFYANTLQTGIIDENTTLPNSNIQIAHMIELSVDNNLTLNGSVNSTEDQYDYYKFDVALGGIYDVNLTGNNSYDIDADLYGADKSDVGNFSNGSDSTDNWTFSALEGGTYYLGIRGFSTSGLDANYTVVINKQ